MQIDYRNPQKYDDLLINSFKIFFISVFGLLPFAIIVSIPVWLHHFPYNQDLFSPERHNDFAHLLIITVNILLFTYAVNLLFVRLNNNLIEKKESENVKNHYLLALTHIPGTILTSLTIVITFIPFILLMLVPVNSVKLIASILMILQFIFLLPAYSTALPMVIIDNKSFFIALKDAINLSLNHLWTSLFFLGTLFVLIYIGGKLLTLLLIMVMHVTNDPHFFMTLIYVFFGIPLLASGILVLFYDFKTRAAISE